MDKAIDERNSPIIRVHRGTPVNTAISDGETRAKVAIEEAEARVEAVIEGAEARVRALIAENERRLRAIADRMPRTVPTPTRSRRETAGADPVETSLPPPLAPHRFREVVSVRAYYKAEQRGFAPGHETDDWLEAERELKAKALASYAATRNVANHYGNTAPGRPA